MGLEAALARETCTFARHLTEFFFLLVYDDVPLSIPPASDFYISSYFLACFSRIEVTIRLSYVSR